MPGQQGHAGKHRGEARQYQRGDHIGARVAAITETGARAGVNSPYKVELVLRLDSLTEMIL